VAGELFGHTQPDREFAGRQRWPESSSARPPAAWELSGHFTDGLRALRISAQVEELLGGSTHVDLRVHVDPRAPRLEELFSARGYRNRDLTHAQLAKCKFTRERVDPPAARAMACTPVARAHAAPLRYARGRGRRAVRMPAPAPAAATRPCTVATELSLKPHRSTRPGAHSCVCTSAAAYLG
jgi:hypothetical protein